MDIVILDRNNIEEYEAYLSSEETENIDRTYYHGMVVINKDSPAAGMIWKIRNVQTDEEKESHIVYLKTENEEAADILFKNYVTAIAEEEINKTTFTLPAITSAMEKSVLEKNGFSVNLTEGDIIKARLSEVAALAFSKQVKPDKSVRSIKTLGISEFSTAIRKFVSNGFYGLCEDLIYLPMRYFEPDISCCIASGEDINGILLFHKRPSGSLAVIVMAYLGGNSKTLLQMMSYALSRAMALYSEDTEIEIDRHNHSTLALAEKLFPRGFGIPVYEGERQERN